MTAAAPQERRLPYLPDDEIPGSGLVVIEPLGVGGSGVVYLALDTGLDQRRTVKIILNSGQGELREEARMLARLRHQNIVRVIRYGVTTDSLSLPYFVMEEANGQSLSKLITKAKAQRKDPRDPLLSFTEILDIAIELFEALAYAHEQGIVHRDIKPANIIIDRDGLVTMTKLIDFGLSIYSDSTRVHGTPMYASPEQFIGGVLTPKSDLYSAGVTLYELIAGKAPFEQHRTVLDLRKAHEHDVPLPILFLIPDTPEDLAHLVMQLLNKLPEHRPRSARNVLETLREIRREFHAHFSMPEIAVATDPGRAQAALQGVFASSHDGYTHELRPSEVSTPVHVEKRTLDINIKTEVDPVFPWLDEIRDDVQNSQVVTRTQNPPLGEKGKIYLDPQEALRLANEAIEGRRRIARKAKLFHMLQIGCWGLGFGLFVSIVIGYVLLRINLG